MADLPKLEGEIVLSAATVVGTFAGAAVSVAAGRYFLTGAHPSGTSSFLATLKTAADTATARTWTFTVDDTNNTSTGTLTITVSGAATTVTWTSTSIRNILGFAANLGAGTSWTSPSACEYLWLPNCGRSGALGPQTSNGHAESDGTFTIAPSGAVYSMGYTARYFDTLEFRTLKASKVFDALETTENESLEEFWNSTVKYGLAVAFYKDRADDATVRYFYVENFQEFKPVPVIENWTDSAQSLYAVGYRVRKYV